MAQLPDLDDALYDEEADASDLEPPQPARGAVFCWTGAALLAVGAFLPVFSVGSRSLSLWDTGDGWVLLALAALTALFVPLARAWVLLNGILAAAFVVYKLVTLSDALSDGTSSPLEWGWLPLFVSFGLICWGYLNSPT